MKTHPLTPGALLENSTYPSTVTRGMMRERAVELAVISGHAAQDVSKTDWEQAKRELTGEPVRGSIGHKAPVTSHENEDDDGRSDSERLVEEGVKEAGHDQMLQAARTPRPENEL